MEDLIPLLIVIAISIFGAINNKNKKKQQLLKREETGNTSNDFLGWLEKAVSDDVPENEEYNEEVAFEPVIAQEPARNKHVQNKSQKIEDNSYANYSGFISPDENQEMMSKEGERSIVRPRTVDKDDLTQQNFFKLEKTAKKSKFVFDGRKAVIYSEILNRKNY